MAYDYANGLFYGISASSHNLYQMNPVTGATSLVGPTGINFADRIGFDISPNAGNTAYFSATVSGQTEFFTDNLATGDLTEVGTIGNPGELTAGLEGIAVAAVPEPGTMSLLVVGGVSLLGFLRRRK
jgi:hypothetical protein